MRTVISNYTEADHVTVSTSVRYVEDIPGLVYLICREGPMEFIFGMVPEQARAMAAAILACADKAEAAEVPA